MEQITNQLKQAGYKLTPQRLAICKLIFESKEHPSAEVIFNELKKAFPTISLATVYKTFSLLTELGLIREVGTEDGKIRIDPNKKLHVNLICTKCGEIKDYITDSITEQWLKIVKEINITPTSQMINIYYECKKCRK